MVKIEIRLPKLLGPDLQEVGTIPCEKCTISETVKPLSSASFTMYSGPALAMHDWVEMFHINGSAGIFRVSRIQGTYDTGEMSIGLEHGLACLDDALVTHGNSTEKDSNGTTTEVIKGTVSACLAHVLQYQIVRSMNVAMWQLGTVAVNDEVKVSINSSILATITSIMAELDDYMLSCDQSTFPWTLSVVAKPTTGVESELRLARNMSTCKINYDDSDMVTRVYCDKLNATTYPNGYMESASGISSYGLVEGYHASNDNEDAAATCAKILRWHDHPKVSITIDAVELFERTGIPLDKLVCGTRCRIALPDYGVTVEEQIIKLQHKDVYRDPRTVTVYMATEADSAAGSMASVSKEVREGKTQIQQVKSEVKLKASQEITKGLFTQVTGSEVQINPDGTLNLSAWNTIKNELGIQNITNALIKLNGQRGTIESKVSSSDLFGETGVWTSLASLAAGIGQIEYDATNNRYVFKNGAGLYVARQEQGQTVNVGIFDEGGSLNAGLIVDAVNGGTTKIYGSKIQIGNSDAETVINGKATIAQLEAAVAQIADQLSESIATGELNVEGTSYLNAVDASSLSVNGTSFGVHTLTDGTNSVDFLGTGDITFDRAAAQREGVNDVYISPSDMIISDGPDYNLNGGSPYYDVEIEASTTSTLFPSLSDTATQSFRVSATDAYRDGYSAGWGAAARGSGRSGNTVTFPSSRQGVFDEATATAHLGGSMRQSKYNGATLYIQVATNVYQAYSGSPLYYAASDSHSASITWS